MNAKKWLTASLLSLTAFALPAWSANSVDAKNAATPSASSSAANNAWMQAATPGENQKVLEPLAGTWTDTVRWWNAPGAKPEETTGSGEIRFILGGRFIEHRFKGTMMGQPMEGRGFIGYDNVKKMYQEVWMDTLSTGMMMSTGNYDATAKTITLSGTMEDPMSGQKNQPMRSVLRIVDLDNNTFEMYGPGPNGKEFKMMEIVSKRQK